MIFALLLLTLISGVGAYYAHQKNRLWAFICLVFFIGYNTRSILGLLSI